MLTPSISKEAYLASLSTNKSKRYVVPLSKAILVWQAYSLAPSYNFIYPFLVTYKAKTVESALFPSLDKARTFVLSLALDYNLIFRDKW